MVSLMNVNFRLFFVLVLRIFLWAAETFREKLQPSFVSCTLWLITRSDGTGITRTSVTKSRRVSTYSRKSGNACGVQELKDGQEKVVEHFLSGKFGIFLSTITVNVLPHWGYLKFV